MESSNLFKYKVVFVRHGESEWNKSNIFTGWTDVDLSDKGIEEALDAGDRIKKAELKFDVVYTSVLKRAIKTWNNIAEVSDQHHVPLIKHWRLNERHYGALQGLNKSETAEKHGEDQVKIWRRAYDIAPPKLEDTDDRYSGNDSKYSKLPRSVLPFTECLKDCVERVLPFWEDHIAKDIIEGKQVLISAHGNSLRSICMHLDNLSKEEVLELDIPTGIPLVYELNENLQPVRHYYLATNDEVKAKIDAVKNQGKVKK